MYCNSTFVHIHMYMYYTYTYYTCTIIQHTVHVHVDEHIQDQSLLKREREREDYESSYSTCTHVGGGIMLPIATTILPAGNISFDLHIIMYSVCVLTSSLKVIRHALLSGWV